jgi:hypothetical protein
VQTPIARHIYSSPAHTTASRSVLHGVIVPGDEWDGLLPNSPFLEQTPAPIRSPIVSGGGSNKRSLIGLGSSPSMPTGKRQRQATMGPMASISIPPSPLGKRQREASGPALITSRPLSTRPLERTVSGPPAMGMGFQAGHRVFSTTSIGSSASTELLSPAMGPYSIQLSTTGSFPTPELIHLNFSEHPTPDSTSINTGTIAPQAIMGGFHGLTGGGFVDSPEVMQQEHFNGHGHGHGQFTLSAAGNALLPVASTSASSPIPMSVPMVHASSFTSHDGRHVTLGTIQEDDMLTPASASGTSFTPALTYSSVGMPSQPSLPSHPTFLSVSYPAVPGISYDPVSSDGGYTTWAQQPGYSHQVSQHGGYVIAPNPSQLQTHTHHQAPMQRATSFNYQMVSEGGSGGGGSGGSGGPMFQPVQRSVSAPYIGTMPSLAGGAPSFSQGGLFGPGPSSIPMSSPVMSLDDGSWNPVHPMPSFSQAQNQNQSQGGSSAGLVSSPNTPTRKRTVYPPVGKRLRPGPKPKPKTPAKGKSRANDDGDVPPPISFTIDPSVFMGGVNNGMGPMLSSSAVPDDEVFMPPSSNPASPPVLVSSNQLQPQQPQQQPRMHYPIPVHAVPQINFGPGTGTSVGTDLDLDLSSLNPIHVPAAGTSNNPTLRMAPPARAQTPEGQALAGLPKDFIDGLYTTFLTMEGSTSGQPVKRFKCLIDGCERHFPRKSAISSHIQTHLDDKPFVCTEPDW